MLVARSWPRSFVGSTSCGLRRGASRSRAYSRPRARASSCPTSVPMVVRWRLQRSRLRRSSTRASYAAAKAARTRSAAWNRWARLGSCAYMSSPGSWKSTPSSALPRLPGPETSWVQVVLTEALPTWSLARTHLRQVCRSSRAARGPTATCRPAGSRPGPRPCRESRGSRRSRWATWTATGWPTSRPGPLEALVESDSCKPCKPRPVASAGPRFTFPPAAHPASRLQGWLGSRSPS